MMQASKEMCSIGISFGRPQLRQPSSDFTLRQELQPAVIACLAGKDDLKVLYTGFLLFLSSMLFVVMPISARTMVKIIWRILEVRRAIFSVKSYDLLYGL